MSVLQAIDRELQMLKDDAGAPIPIQLGCTEIAHEKFGFCDCCAINKNEALCWRLLALRERQVPAQEEADRLLNYAMTICMYGERAPGGDETWEGFARRAESYLRRRGCAKRGFHTPEDPMCPDCKGGL